MNWRIYLLLFLLALLITGLVALFQTSPGYMDADYYYSGGVRLAEGQGFTEEFLWNYLDNPAGLPHPSHAYWMPMASMVAALGMLIAGSTSFWAGRLVFLGIAGLVAPITAALAHAVTGNKNNAILSGLLAAISCFYLAYLGTIDTFSIYMLLGGTWLLILGNKRISSGWPITFWGFALGLMSGLFHLARADGLSWLIVSGVAVLNHTVWKARLSEPLQVLPSRASRVWLPVTALIALVLGYLVIMGPWIARNKIVFGTLLSPGGVQALWITDYDELYAYPPGLLTPARWWASGLRAIVEARLQALGQNLQTALAVQGEIFLAPLIIFGLWRLRKDTRVWLGVISWVLTFGVMTLIFPWAGWRGGFFHSGAAVQPLLWAVAPVGLDVFIEWGQRVRGWDYRQASRVFRTGLVALALFLSVFTVQKRVIGISINHPAWGRGWEAYLRLESALRAHGIDPQAKVMVNNAPGYYAANRRPALSIPDGGVDVSLAVAKRYNAAFLLLEGNHPRGLNELYQHPNDLPGLRYLFSYEDTRVFSIK
jgi:hypothetical protein